MVEEINLEIIKKHYEFDASNDNVAWIIKSILYFKALIGIGTSSKVLKIIEKVTGKERAIKIIPKTKVKN